MARIRGIFVDINNYEVSIKKPYDSRMLVPTYSDLTNKANWLALDPDTLEPTTATVVFNGLIVAVADKDDVEHSGLYMLFDKLNKKNPNVEDESNWLKIGETTDITDFVNRLAGIDEEISSIKSRLTSLEDYPDVETVDTFSTLPVPGTENKLYVVADERKSYVWFNDGYLPVGGSDYEEPSIIYGGSAK
jgi:hypothetical protein